MQNEEKGIAKGVLLTISAILLIIVFTTTCAVAVQAKTGLMGEDDQARIYSNRLGYFTVAGKTYYAHHSRSAMYKKGELLTNGYRVRNNKMYYFGPDGAMVTRKTPRNKSTRYIDFNRDGSVHYIYPAGYFDKEERYNANRYRFQVLNGGKWQDTGMQCWPFGWIDWQW
jgi:hypothetical protein